MAIGPWPMYVFPWADSLPLDTVYIPEDWILRVSKFESGMLDGNELNRIKEIGAHILKEREIRSDLGNNGFPMRPEEAKFVCKLYLTTMNKSQWPTLLGIHSVMDSMLGQEFKK